jgi:hypothetical protein
LKNIFLILIYCILQVNCRVPDAIVEDHGYFSIKYEYQGSKDYKLLEFRPKDNNQVVVLLKDSGCFFGSYFDSIIGNCNYNESRIINLENAKGDFKDTFKFFKNPDIESEVEFLRLVKGGKAFLFYNGVQINKIKVEYYANRNQTQILQRWFYKKILLYKYESSHS